MEVGDLIVCVSDHPDEPVTGSLGIVLRVYHSRTTDLDEPVVVAHVNHYGEGRIWENDWEILAKKTIYT